MEYWNKFTGNVSLPIVISSALGAGLLGFAVFVVKKLNVKPLTDAANIAKKGAKS